MDYKKREYAPISLRWWHKIIIFLVAALILLAIGRLGASWLEVPEVHVTYPEKIVVAVYAPDGSPLPTDPLPDRYITVPVAPIPAPE